MVCWNSSCLNKTNKQTKKPKPILGCADFVVYPARTLISSLTYINISSTITCVIHGENNLSVLVGKILRIK